MALSSQAKAFAGERELSDFSTATDEATNVLHPTHFLLRSKELNWPLIESVGEVSFLFQG